MAAKLCLLILTATLVMTHIDSAHAQTAASPIRYAVSFPAPHTHYVEVRADVPTAGRPEIELMMPVWTPGSYLVREFSRHIENVRAADPAGRTLRVVKSDKNRWRVTTGGAARAVVSYKVYARE